MKFTEAQLESAIIELLGVEGYPHVLGEAIDLSAGDAQAGLSAGDAQAGLSDGQAGRQPQEVLIKADLRAFLAKQYAADHITPQEIEAVIKQLEAYSAADLYESNKAIMRLVSDGFHLKRERTLTPGPSPKGRGESDAKVSDGFLLKREDRSQKDRSNPDRSRVKLSGATIRKFRIVRTEGSWHNSVVRIFQTTASDGESYNLPAAA
jgi:hypothetical protein